MDINLFDVVSTTFGVDKSKKKNTDITDFTQIGLHGLFFFDIILPMNLGFCLDSEGFGALWCSLLPDEFVTLTMSSANHFSPLSFSNHPNLPQGKEQVTLLCQRLVQSIISAPSRSQTHPSLPQGKEQVTLLCQRLVQSIISAPSRSPP